MPGSKTSRVGNSDSGAHRLERCRRIPKTNHQDPKISKNQELRGFGCAGGESAAALRNPLLAWASGTSAWEMGATGKPGGLTEPSRLQDSFFCALVPNARTRSGSQSLFPTHHSSQSCVIPGSLWSWGLCGSKGIGMIGMQCLNRCSPVLPSKECKDATVRFSACSAFQPREHQ
jgi:hypothetical protein